MTLISLEEAQKVAAEHELLRTAVEIALEDAVGRILAKPVFADVDRPFSDLSAMDGYAVRLADVVDAHAKLKVIGEVAAGQMPDKAISAGECMRIFTGAPLPEGSDHIVIQEDVTRTGDQIITELGYADAEFVRRKGSDFARNDELIGEGALLTPAALSLIAAANVGNLQVYAPLRAAILMNGNELQSPGQDLTPGAIPESNSYGLSGLLRSHGCDVVATRFVSDSRTDISRAIEELSDSADLILTVGGASVGDHDLMRPCFTDAGFGIQFSGVAVRPGKPTWLAKRGTQVVLGLPGNPASSFVCAQLFLPFLSGTKPLQERNALCRVDLKANGRREHLMRASAWIDDQGTLVVEPFASQDSGNISVLAKSNALIRRPVEASAVSLGDQVSVLLTGELF